MVTVETNILDLPMPGLEVVSLNLDDGDSYSSSKISEIQAVKITLNTDEDRDINATWSGRVITVNVEGASGVDVTLEIFGRQ